MKESGLPFSFDQKDFWKSRARTPAEALDASILRHQEIEYLVAKNEEQEHTELYQHMSAVAMELDEVYGLSLRMGTSLVDGAVIATDVIERFAPYLLPRVGKLVEEHIEEHYDISYPYRASYGTYTDDQQRAYVDYFIQPIPNFTPRFSPEFTGIVTRLAAGKYAHDYQQNTVRSGFEFVMLNAEMALAQDNKSLKQLEHMFQLGHSAITSNALDLELQVLIAEKEQYKIE